MWFWSVSWSTNCPVYFSLFLVDQKKFVQSQGIFGQALIFLVDQISFWYTKIFFLVHQKFLVDQIFFWYTKETDQKYMDAAYV